ncbi:TPA: hypothetical protein ACGO28_000346 [Streptococcus suis]
MRDLELLLNKVSNRNVKDYYKEAIVCYNVGSYRAAILLAVSTGMEDLFSKMESISKRHRDEENKRDDAKIQKLYSSIDYIKSLKNNNKSWERELIQFYGRPSFGDHEGLDVFSKSEREDLEHCFNIRNSCAHLSTENPSSEKARFVITTMIDLISSREMILGYVHLEELLERISYPYFFPSSNTEDMNRRVIQEIGTILPRSHKYFVQELFKKLESDDVHYNFSLFASRLFNLLSTEAKDEYKRKLINFLERNSIVVGDIFRSNLSLISQTKLDESLLYLYYKDTLDKDRLELHQVLAEIKSYNETFVNTKCQELIEEYSENPDNLYKLAPFANLFLQGSQELKESYIKFLIKWIDYYGTNDYYSKTGVKSHVEAITYESVRELENVERFYLVIKLVIIYLQKYQSVRSRYYEMDKFGEFIKKIDESILCRNLFMSEQDYQKVYQSSNFINEIYRELYNEREDLFSLLQDNPNLGTILNELLDRFSMELESKDKQTIFQECGEDEAGLVDASLNYLIDEREHYNFLKE